MLVACGRAWRDEDRLGKARRFDGTPLDASREDITKNTTIEKAKGGRQRDQRARGRERETVRRRGDLGWRKENERQNLALLYLF